MEASKITQQFKENKWLKFGAIIPALILLILAFFLVRSWFAPREPEVPSEWYQETVGYWAFEQVKGQEIIDTAGRNHGQLGADIKADKRDPKQEGGKLGSGLKFEGEDYALVPYSSEFDLKEEVSLEAWVKPRASSANEELWMSGWKYRKRIIVKNKKRDVFENAQVKLVMDTKSLIEQNKLQSDCEDLRFTRTNKITKLDWYIEEGCNSTTTEVWVKMPHLKAEAETPIYAYYGNFDASSESGFEKVMETPPLKSWEWPQQPQEQEEKALSAVINSKDQIVAGGYRKRRGKPGEQWKISVLRPRGIRRKYRTYNFSSGSNQVNDVAVDSGDVTILAGFDTEKGDSQWRIKRRGSGKGFWDYTINPSSGSDRATAVTVDSSDGIIVGGFDNSKGNAQWRVERLSSEGEKLWTYTKNPSSGVDMVKDITVDSEGNILVAGIDKEKGNDQWRLEKLSPDGDFLYAYLLDISDGSDILTDVEVDSQDNIILAGTDFKKGNFQWKVVKLNSEAERIWSYEENYSSGSDEINAMEIDEHGNILIGGYDYTEGNAQWRTEKLSSNGEKLWTYTDNPSSGFDVINGIGIDSKGNIALVGVSGNGSAEFLVQKISERKYYDLEPEVRILEETTFREIPSLVVGKLGSYGLRAGQEQVTGSVNGNLISASLGSGWNHLVLTYDGSQQKLYVNSELEASQALTGNINTNYNNLLLGFNYAGLLDEVKIYNEALTSEEVERIYNSF